MPSHWICREKKQFSFQHSVVCDVLKFIIIGRMWLIPVCSLNYMYLLYVEYGPLLLSFPVYAFEKNIIIMNDVN